MHQPSTAAAMIFASLPTATATTTTTAVPEVVDLKGFFGFGSVGISSDQDQEPNQSHLPPKKRHLNRSGSPRSLHTLTPYSRVVNTGSAAAAAAAVGHYHHHHHHHPQQHQQHQQQQQSWSLYQPPPNYHHYQQQHQQQQQFYYHHHQHQTPLQMLSAAAAFAAAAAAAAATTAVPTGSTPGNHFSPSALSTTTSSSRLSDTSADSGFINDEELLQQPLDLSITTTTTPTSTIISSAPVKDAQVSPKPSTTPKRPSRKSGLETPLKRSKNLFKPEISSSSSSSSFSSTPILSCPECGKVYSSSSRFRAHLRRHESKQSGRYRCTVCAKNFVQRSSLKTHERIHTGERPYHCSLCDQRFGDFSTFTKHRRTHTGEKPYACPHCSKAFSQSGNMHRHRATVHGNVNIGEDPAAVATKIEQTEQEQEQELGSWVH